MKQETLKIIGRHHTVEQTVEAFLLARELGFDNINMDMIVGLPNEDMDDVRHTLEELKKLNIGLEHGWTVPFCTAEEVFEQFANKITFNIHLKEHGEDGYLIRELVKLAESYQATEHIYFSGSPDELKWMQEIAPEIPRNAIQFPEDTIGIFDMAKKYDCFSVQFWLGMFDEELIEKLHDAGINCNLYFADTLEDYEKYFNMGIDTLLTNRMDLAAYYQKTYRG